MGSTRRALIGGLAGGLVGGAALSAIDSEAKKKKKKKGKKGKGKGKGGKGRCKQDSNGCKKAKDCCSRNCSNGVCGGGGGTPVPSGPTFTVSGRNILNPAGNPVLLRGVNNMSVFDEEDPNGASDFIEIAKTGANTVRIVWAMVNDRGQTTDPAVMNTLIQNARNAGLVPMIELHDATGDLSKLPQLTAYWTRPEVVNIINSHSQYVLLNIGNEVGDGDVGSQQFINAYTTSIQAIRAAGIKVPLVIDAPDFGKNLLVLNDAAAPLLAADPLKNLIFSVHMYWPMNGGATPKFIKDNLELAVSLNYPLIIGEFSKYGAFNGNESICAEPGGLCDYVTIVSEANRLGIGWYAWEWGPGNEFGGAGCEKMNMTTNSKFATLQAGWATEVATTLPGSIKNTAKSAF
jgi:mannan endo-1,4-beta-mannosidase